MGYLKENTHFLTKLFLNQFGAAFMGLVLSLTVGERGNALVLFTSVFCILFYMVLQYTAMWDLGARDIIRVEGKRMEYKPFTGLYMTFWANIPNMIIAIGVVVGSVFGSEEGAFGYKWAGSLYVVFKAIGIVWESMYNGLVQLYSPHNPIIYVLMIIPPMFAGCLGYYSGLKNFSLLNKLGIKTKSNK